MAAIQAERPKETKVGTHLTTLILHTLLTGRKHCIAFSLRGTFTKALQLAAHSLVDALGNVANVLVVQASHADAAVASEVDVTSLDKCFALLGYYCL